MELSYRHKQPHRWQWIIWILLGILTIIGFIIFANQDSVQSQSNLTTATPTYTPQPTSTVAPTATLTPEVRSFILSQPTAIPAPVPGGQDATLEPDPKDMGWVVSEEDENSTLYPPPNHFGDSFLYAGILNGKLYHGVFQFDLSDIPRGTKVYRASVRLAGLRAEQLNTGGGGSWQLHMLPPEVDYKWHSQNFEQIHEAAVWTTFEPTLTQADLGKGRINQFEFNSEQLALLERRILEGPERSDRKISFRLDGPMEGDNNLFAWDSGVGPISEENGPELFLSLGPPPATLPPPYYVIITSTPTPKDIMMAATISLRLTAEATQYGTATPLPPSWVTPEVVTAVPSPGNEATAQANDALATAIALTKGEPFNLYTATPTPTYHIITSTPTPQDIRTAVAISLQSTAEATRLGTSTPLPHNWVTPVVITTTTISTPANLATAEYLQAVLLTTGTPTPLPGNAQTATPTPTYVIITSTPTPESVMTAAAISMQITAEAAQYGTVTPLPSNWVTPVVVTETPVPDNPATAEYWQAVALTTGTPTSTPGNVQIATPTPFFILVESLIQPTPTITPSATPQPVPDIFLGKIIFLSDREGATEEERRQAALRNNRPLEIQPQPYLFDPETGQLGRVTDIWPYEVASIREAWSANGIYEVYTQQLLWTNVEKGNDQHTDYVPTTIFALHVYDYEYKVEKQITHFGAGWAWDPAWSPVNDQITFVSNDSADDEIWVINRDGSNARQLTSSNEAYNAREIGKDSFLPEVNGHPSWSPDGSQIVFWSNRTRNRQLWIMNADGTNQRLLMEGNPYNDWDPVWVKYTDPAPPLSR